MKVLANFEDNHKIPTNSGIDNLLDGGVEKEMCIRDSNSTVETNIVKDNLPGGIVNVTITAKDVFEGSDVIICLLYTSNCSTENMEHTWLKKS